MIYVVTLLFVISNTVRCYGQILIKSREHRLDVVLIEYSLPLLPTLLSFKRAHSLYSPT